MDSYQTLNDVLVNLFRDIMDIEQKAVATQEFHDITSNDLHVIEVIGVGSPKNMSTIAKELSVTVGTLTIAVNGLVKKGYVEKLRGEEDARIVYVTLTKQGKKIDSVHRYFHESMVRSIISGMSEQEQQVLYQGILKLDLFLKKKISE